LRILGEGWSRREGFLSNVMKHSDAFGKEMLEGAL